MPASRPQLGSLSLAELAVLVERKPGTVSRLLKAAGLEPLRTANRTAFYDPRRALPVIFGVGALSLQHERARLAAMQADREALRLQLQRGEVASLPEVAAAWGQASTAIRTRVLGIATKVAPRAHGAASIREAEAAIYGECEEALRVLSETEPEDLFPDGGFESADEPDDGDAPEAT